MLKYQINSMLPSWHGTCKRVSTNQNTKGINSINAKKNGGNIMKRIALVLGIVASLAVSQIANATPYTQTFADSNLNWATWTASSNNDVDAFGSPDIASTSVTMETVGQLQQLQKITFNLDSFNRDVFSGDLFIDTSSDQKWDYVVRSLGKTPNGTSSVGLYAINVGIHDTSAYQMSYYYDPISPLAPSYFRSDLPVGLKTTPNSFIGNVGYSANSTSIAFDFTGLPQNNQLFFDSEFTIGYQVTCANDVVYQQIPVPEPGTMALLGFGMLGLAIFGKRKMNKEA
jgi:hypothetical protein